MPIDTPEIRRRRSHRFLAWGLVLMFGTMSAAAGSSAESTPSAPRVTGAAASPEAPSAHGIHRTFDAVLADHAQDGRVDYPGIAADPRFERYLGQLARVRPEDLPSREARLAYWINAYNAFAIKGILDGHSPGTFFGRIGYFKLTEYRAGGREIDLYDLERKVLIPMGEPRIHFAIVCASSSCPRLPSEAYVPERLEQQLERSARHFINDPSRNRFDTEAGVAHLSKIFDWFEEDFAGAAGSVAAYVARYVENEKVAQALREGRLEIRHLRYDWSLNGMPPES
ncbi:MAG: DUF547 domain-containing protein [Gammaproteobacteria bacterium]|nr:DUF547 domain-containing protein [Gammaproteobacteria bacterium]NIR82100.1 DUF547 domain-containing protein [Gammaproteobacteria bacterium]NIR89333.1 DUF547 domain-containing protein [Gammaproteobacteria bacterium]NIU03210.1 DUF547 domain-containing protein [Gammaproteobacteria bacterium]NIV74505.1 DUF547 domain-containing protein [Gammaproteobacteria bacterium]